MSKSYRIRTTPGEGNGFLKVNVDLNQNYDFLEILSLKISQKNDYQSFCAEYGVVAGRVIVNGGFGVPNVKVSIFVPVTDEDLLNPVKSAIYNYTEPFPEQKNANGIRYNLLPKNQQSLDHTPVGTFPKKREILDDNTTLEIYEKYYKYTTTTNEAGDYIIFGVPVGQHFLHYDMDVSDIGFLSTRPFELINVGYPENLFSSRFKFKNSNNLDSLPQIFSENIPITVEPYWCDSLSVGSALGINRYDIEPNVEIIPTSVFMGSIFSDDEKDSLNKNCKPSRQMGKMNEVITGPGRIEALRRTVDGAIERFNFKEDSIDENGNWSVLVPMNLRKVVTDEFGNLIPSPDGIKGVATEGDYRFRISMDATSTDKRLRQRAKFLVPNTNNNFVFNEYSSKDLQNSELFTKNQQLSTITTGTDYENDLSNQYNYLEEFYPFRWKKVYTVKQYIGRMQKSNSDEARGFIGIKDILNAEGVNKFPSNRVDTNINPLYTIICILLTLFGNIVGFLNGVINIVNGLVTAICQLKIPLGLKVNLVYCFSPLGVEFCNAAYRQSCGCGSASNNYDCGSGNSGCGQGCECGRKLDLVIYIKWGCLFGRVLCQKCQSSCPEGNSHSCCPVVVDNNEGTNPQCNTASNNYAYGCPCNNERILFEAGAGIPATPCCSDCCVKIPLIPLRCGEEDLEVRVSHIPSPFASSQCNKTYVLPYGCKTCGGLQTAGVKDWVNCVLEPVAVFLRMLKFDFYNDWVGGSLYFPLIKRQYKLKKNKRKFGQIKKDKFCDFECRIREGGNLTTNFQGDATFKQWRIKIPTIVFSNPTITFNGCTAKVKGRRVSNWYGTQENDDETYNLNLAVKEFIFNGKTSSQDGCVIKFNEFSELNSALNDPPLSLNIDLVKERDVPTEHGKPEYVETEDAISGLSTWENVGGHGHHRNICDNTRMMERKEFFKTSLDCIGQVNDADIDADNLLGNPDGTFNLPEPEEASNLFGQSCEGLDCNPSCGNNGVAPCKNKPVEYDDYTPIIEHGLISWHEGEIYYTPYIPNGDIKENKNEYKANLMIPTTIMELGSMNYCDIDDVPFIMDILEPTTFQVSYEDFKYKGSPVIENGGYISPDGLAGNLTEITKLEDKKDSSLNLRAYVEFSCTKVVCLNISAIANQSQIGVDIVDKNDIGIEAGNCFVRFDHDEEIRQYFCRRFNGYKADRTFHHIRPGGTDTDNEYKTYSEIEVQETTPLFYQFPDGQVVLSEYNDSDSFISGDACGYKVPNSNPDYFYGLAPGITGNFINYPNGAGTLTFGDPFVTDEVNDNVDSVSNASGIRFNRTQTPYHLYFGLVPGKTALHKTVGKFFADKINAISLQGLGKSNESVEETKNNTPGINNGNENKFTVYKTCLGETLLETNTVGSGVQNTNNTGSGSQGNNNSSGESGSSGGGNNGGNSGGNGNPGVSIGGPVVGIGNTGTPSTGNNNNPTQNTQPSNNFALPNTINGETTIQSAIYAQTEYGTITVSDSPFNIYVTIYGGPCNPISNPSPAFHAQVTVDGTLYDYYVPCTQTQTYTITVNTNSNLIDYTLKAFATWSNGATIEISL